MLDYATTHPVRYCIINKVDRLACNRLDDAKIHAALQDANISLVSVAKNIDETPQGGSCTASWPPWPSSTR
ncbi:hypothetical protein CJBVI_0445 [Corynebacterium jeikeium]|nr:hypothetical protein CJBVI_0445 [Corynebacterium jeikeium]